MLVIGIAVGSVVWLAVFASAVNYGVRRGYGRSYTNVQSSAAVAACAGVAAIGLVAARWDAALIATLLCVPAVLFWLYVNR